MLLNCDLGEIDGQGEMAPDPLVMPYIDMANIACGYHAGDPETLQKTVALAKQYQVRIGAHPSYPDRENFGRRSMRLSHEEIENMLIDQLGALSAVCQSQACQLSYVKPHGALYNDMMKNDKVLFGIFSALQKFNPNLPLMLMATADNEGFRRKAEQFSISLIFEAFADRAYDDEGVLVPRTVDGSVYHSAELILNQALQLKSRGVINSINGKELKIEAQTLCVHGDNHESVKIIQMLKQGLSA